MHKTLDKNHSPKQSKRTGLLYLLERSDFMLKSLTTHSCYLKQLNDVLSKVSPSLISEYDFEISLFRLLNFDPVFPLIELPFSSTGRPARLVIEKLRALFYAARHAYSPKELHHSLRTSPMTRALCGF